MLLYCLKVLKTLLPLTLLLLILCLTVSSLVPFILQQIALNNNSFYLATSLDFFTLAISGFFFFFVDISYYSHTANAFDLQASDFSFFFRFGYGFCQHLWYLIVPDVLFNLWCCIIWDKRSSIRPVFQCGNSSLSILIQFWDFIYWVCISDKLSFPLHIRRFHMAFCL